MRIHISFDMNIEFPPMRFGRFRTENSNLFPAYFCVFLKPFLRKKSKIRKQGNITIETRQMV